MDGKEGPPEVGDDDAGDVEPEDEHAEETDPEDSTASKRCEPGASAETELAEYRRVVVAAMQKSQDDYDKAVLSLSGGALGLTFALFQKAHQTRQCLVLLETAWILWTLSLVAILISFFTGREANRVAIKQVDTGTVYQSIVGGAWARSTTVLNWCGGIFFLAGLVIAVVYLIESLR
jgi:hypothetical protein